MVAATGAHAPANSQISKLTGRAFYESIGSPKMVVAPMVDRSEFAWRMLTRSYMDEEGSNSLLAYTPMFHARLFAERVSIRDQHFQPTRESLKSKEKSTSGPYLDGNPSTDRPIFVQFCANKPDDFLEAAQYVAPYCDAVDLNLGCPQGIAKAGQYGAFLQEDWDLIYQLINRLHRELPVPVTAKMRILDTKERTLEYAKMILSAGASIITVHGRRREQKGHNMGIADWSMIRYLRDNLPPETVIFANGNILNREDIQPCLDATGADAVMSAEGNLSDPTIFAKPPSQHDDREYWRGTNGQEGYRIDGVFRRYLDIIYKYVLEIPPPERKPLYTPSDSPLTEGPAISTPDDNAKDEPPRKKQKLGKGPKSNSPNLKAMQGHLFQLMRPFLATHTEIRDALSKCKAGNMAGFERVLAMLEEAVKTDLSREAASYEADGQLGNLRNENMQGSQSTIEKYKRPWWVCQPFIRPSPEEAVKLGALSASKRERAKMEAEAKTHQAVSKDHIARLDDDVDYPKPHEAESSPELSKAALVCG